MIPQLSSFALPVQPESRRARWAVRSPSLNTASKLPSVAPSMVTLWRTLPLPPGCRSTPSRSSIQADVFEIIKHLGLERVGNESLLEFARFQGNLVRRDLVSRRFFSFGQLQAARNERGLKRDFDSILRRALSSAISASKVAVFAQLLWHHQRSSLSRSPMALISASQACAGDIGSGGSSSHWRDWPLLRWR